MSDGEVRTERKGDVVHVTFDRQAARNAMTWQMYQTLGEACEKLRADTSVRAVVFRGAGGKSFIAGTDIAQFKEFKSGEDGVAYEEKMEIILSGIEALPMPTLCVVEGFAIGGGLAIAACCDLRIATPGSRFGIPIARTLGNCLSVANYARLIASIGMPRAKKMLLLAENITAEEALAGGFLVEIVQPADVDKRIAELTDRLVRQAPITMRVTKEAMRRLLHASFLDGDDLVRQAFGSEDFRTGVAAFVEKKEPQWRGK
ncbi:MAG: enoyl-CoA hydratase/isomerase family protein [Xanthobacteraceae bacterium]|jgi:enoyl-CoA hydratase